MTNRDHSPSISKNDGGDAKSRTEGSGLDLDALEAVARAAEPLDEEYDESTPVELAAIERFNATFDPPTVLRLIQTQRELVAALSVLTRQCEAEFTVDGHWVHDGQLVSRAAYARARAALAKASPPPSARPGESDSGQTLEASPTLQGDQ